METSRYQINQILTPTLLPSSNVITGSKCNVTLANYSVCGGTCYKVDGPTSTTYSLVANLKYSYNTLNSYEVEFTIGCPLGPVSFWKVYILF